jgi:hypothetical protein
LVPLQVNSTVWRLNTTTTMYEHLQDLPSNGCYDHEFFTLQGRCVDSKGSIVVTTTHYLAAAFSDNGTAVDLASPIYRWNQVWNVKV